MDLGAPRDEPRQMLRGVGPPGVPKVRPVRLSHSHGALPSSVQHEEVRAVPRLKSPFLRVVRETGLPSQQLSFREKHGAWTSAPVFFNRVISFFTVEL